MKITPYVNMPESRPPPLFTSCCFCLPIRVGCFIMGYINLTYHFLFAVAVSAFVLMFGIETHGFDHIDKLGDQSINDLLLQRILLKYFAIIFSFVIFLKFVWVIVNILCIVGLHKRRADLLRWYVIFMKVRITLAIVGVMYTLFHVAHHVCVFIQIFDIGWTIYIVLMFNVYIDQLIRDRDARAEETKNKMYAQNITTNTDENHLTAKVPIA